MKKFVFGLLCVAAATAQGAVSTDTSKLMNAEEAALVDKYTPAMDEALVTYAHQRADEEYDLGQAGCERGYILEAREPYVLYHNISENYFYSTAYFTCLDDDGMSSLSREALLMKCNKNSLSCVVSTR